MEYIFNSAKLNELRNRTHFLYKDAKEIYEKKPLDGVKILHCLPLTYESLCKVEPLLFAGADLTVTGCKGIAANPEVEMHLKTSQVKYERDHSFIKGNFDIYLDCAGQLAEIGKPNIGTVELTKFGSDKYKKMHLDYPVISVDETQTKIIECKYGVSEAFVRAFQYMTGESLKNKSVVLFGCGKLGTGILELLVKQNSKVTVIGKNAETMEIASYFSANFIDGFEISKVKEAIKKSFCVVTATGVKNLISKIYKLTPFDFADAYLVDMGGVDEFGDLFPEERILGNKKPINFYLDHPVLIEYVDPIFYAHNLSAFLLLDKMFPFPGFYPFPKELDIQIVNIFEKKYHKPQFSWIDSNKVSELDFLKIDY